MAKDVNPSVKEGDNIILIYMKVPFNLLLKEGIPYFYRCKGSTWRQMPQTFSLTLLLFHLIWNHNNNGNSVQSPLAVISH